MKMAAVLYVVKCRLRLTEMSINRSGEEEITKAAFVWG